MHVGWRGCLSTDRCSSEFLMRKQKCSKKQEITAWFCTVLRRPCPQIEPVFEELLGSGALRVAQGIIPRPRRSGAGKPEPRLDFANEALSERGPPCADALPTGAGGVAQGPAARTVWPRARRGRPGCRQPCVCRVTRANPCCAPFSLEAPLEARPDPGPPCPRGSGPRTPGRVQRVWSVIALGARPREG